MSSEQLQLRDGHGVPMVKPSEDANNLLAIIATAVADPRMDVEKIERLLAVHQTIMAEQRKQAYIQAMARLAPRLPEIDKNGHVVHETKNGMVDRRYARLEDIDRAIRPLYSAEGFSISWNTGVGDGGKVRVIGTCSHIEGHAETRQLDLPHDSSGSKNPVQAVNSTVSYGKRIITTMIFNLIAKDEDKDGEDLDTITDEQIKDLEAMITETGTNKSKFLVYMDVDAVPSILKIKYKRAIEFLDAKRRAQK